MFIFETTKQNIILCKVLSR